MREDRISPPVRLRAGRVSYVDKSYAVPVIIILGRQCCIGCDDKPYLSVSGDSVARDKYATRR